jgi:hypothetical protein
MSADQPATNGNCLNCGTPLQGRFCIECGQPARTRSLTFWELLREFFEEAFDLDSKAWRSLIRLMFQPGRITTEYLAGRRARYVSPLRLYLTASVLFFIVAAVTGNTPRVSWGDYNEERQRLEAAGEENEADVIIAQAGGCDDIEINIDTDWGPAWQQHVIEACKRVTADSGKSLERASIDNIPFMMVIFIPVLALVMKLLYPFSKRLYVEHLVFYLHYHSFGFFWLMTLIAIYEAGDAVGWPGAMWRAVGIASSAYMAGYLFIAMRKVYGQGVFVTSLKFTLLFFTYVTALSMSLFGVLLYTALTL